MIEWEKSRAWIHLPGLSSTHPGPWIVTGLLEIRVSSSAEGGIDDNGRAYLMGLLSGLNEIM